MDLRRKTGEWLDRASAGERIVIERDHRPMAVLVPYELATQWDEATRAERQARRRAALKRLSALGDRMAKEHPARPEDHDGITPIRWERDHEHGDHG